MSIRHFTKKGFNADSIDGGSLYYTTLDGKSTGIVVSKTAIKNIEDERYLAEVAKSMRVSRDFALEFSKCNRTQQQYEAQIENRVHMAWLELDV